MILTADMGNSRISLGGFENGKIVFSASIATDPTASEDEYACRILSVLSLHGVTREQITGSALSSVVPQLNPVLEHALSFLLGKAPLTVGPGIKTGIRIRCDDPSSVGSDLICASVAAHFVYERPCLIADLGTATKMTVVSGDGSFCGTSITAGIVTGLDALSNSAAQLPKVAPEAPNGIIAKNTSDCMKSGAVYGHACMLDGMAQRIEEEYGEPLCVIITGGYAETVLPHCRRKMTLDKNLVLKGLDIIYKRNVKYINR